MGHDFGDHELGSHEYVGREHEDHAHAVHACVDHVHAAAVLHERGVYGLQTASGGLVPAQLRSSPLPETWDEVVRRVAAPLYQIHQNRENGPHALLLQDYVAPFHFPPTT